MRSLTILTAFVVLAATPATAVESDATTLENEFFKITFNSAQGTITSLVDKRTAREWVDTSAAQGLGQYLNERFTFEQTLKYVLDYQQGRAAAWPHPGLHKPGMISEKQVPYRAASPTNGTLKVTRDDVAQTAILDLPANPANHLPRTALRVTLYQGRANVDLEIILKNKPKDNWPEADWLGLPFKVNAPRFTVGRALGMMHPATDILPGANRDLYAVGSGVTLTDADGSGIAVCPLDHPLVSAYGTDFDGHKGTLLRLWEQGGVTGGLTVTLPAGSDFATATPVNLRGETTGEPLKITAGKLVFTLKAFAPASFILN